MTQKEASDKYKKHIDLIGKNLIRIDDKELCKVVLVSPVELNANEFDVFVYIEDSKGFICYSGKPEGIMAFYKEG